jgi:mitochondrial-processing peptidase subunit beta
MGQPTGGIRENLNNITQDSIKAFLNNNYTTQNTVVAFAGTVNHEAMVSACSAFKFNEV